MSTWAWTETSRADTGSSATTSDGFSAEGAGDADALALTAGELVGVATHDEGSRPTVVKSSVTRCIDLRASSPNLLIRSGSATMSPTVRRGLSEA